MVTRRFTPTAMPFRAVAAVAALIALLLSTLAFSGQAGAQVGPSVTVTPDTDLPLTGAAMTVAGSGFSENVYVALGPAGLESVPNWFMQPNLFTGAQRVTAASMTSGSFSV